MTVRKIESSNIVTRFIHTVPWLYANLTILLYNHMSLREEMDVKRARSSELVLLTKEAAQHLSVLIGLLQVRIVRSIHLLLVDRVVFE